MNDRLLRVVASLPVASRGRRWERRALIDVALMAGLVVAPVGWSYDQVMLLIPLLSVLGWAADGTLNKREAVVIVWVLVAANALTFYQRIQTPSEVWFFWVPLVMAGAYGYARRRRRV